MATTIATATEEEDRIAKIITKLITNSKSQAFNIFKYCYLAEMASHSFPSVLKSFCLASGTVLIHISSNILYICIIHTNCIFWLMPNLRQESQNRQKKIQVTY